MALATKNERSCIVFVFWFCRYYFVDRKLRIDLHDIHMVDSHDTHVAFSKRNRVPGYLKLFDIQSV